MQPALFLIYICICGICAVSVVQSVKILRDVQCFAGVRVVNVNVSDLDVM